MIAIVGRPNVGKSTLMNALVGQKISITSRKAQTTRHRITGINTTEDAQYIFVDTPGFQTRHSTALNRSLNRAVTSTLTSVDAILFVIEAGRFGPDDQKVLDLIPPGVPTLLIANKLDRVNDKTTLYPFMQQVSALREFSEIVPLSAKHPEDIQRLLETIKPYLPRALSRRRDPAREGVPLDRRRTALHEHRRDRQVRGGRAPEAHLRDDSGRARLAQGDGDRQEGREAQADQHRGADGHGKAVRRPRVPRNLREGEERLGRQRGGAARLWVRMTHLRRPKTR